MIRKKTKTHASIAASVFLCQLIYWKGKETNKDGWIYKTQKDIEDETGLSREEQESARRTLYHMGVLEERDDRPEHKKYYRINLNVINDIWDEWANEQYNQKDDTEKPQRQCGKAAEAIRKSRRGDEEKPQRQCGKAAEAMRESRRGDEEKPLSYNEEITSEITSEITIDYLHRGKDNFFSSNEDEKPRPYSPPSLTQMARIAKEEWRNKTTRPPDTPTEAPDNPEPEALSDIKKKLHVLANSEDEWKIAFFCRLTRLVVANGEQQHVEHLRNQWANIMRDLTETTNVDDVLAQLGVHVWKGRGGDAIQGTMKSVFGSLSMGNGKIVQLR